MLGLYRRLIIETSGPNTLVITKSKQAQILNLFAQAFFFMFWYSTLLGGRPNNLADLAGKIQNRVSLTPLIWVFIAAPLFSIIPSIFYSLKTILLGEVFMFDKAQNHILHNTKKVAQLDEVSHIQIRTFHGRRGYKSYLLMIIQKHGEKIKIDQSSNFEEISFAADHIADITKARVNLI